MITPQPQPSTGGTVVIVVPQAGASSTREAARAAQRAATVLRDDGRAFFEADPAGEPVAAADGSYRVHIPDRSDVQRIRQLLTEQAAMTIVGEETANNTQTNKAAVASENRQQPSPHVPQAPTSAGAPGLLADRSGPVQRMAHLLVKIAFHRAKDEQVEWEWRRPPDPGTLQMDGAFEDSIAPARAAAEERLRRLNYDGSQPELAAALTDALMWRDSSPGAAEALANLIEFYRAEHGLIIDPATGGVGVDPDIDPGWQEFSEVRVADLKRAVSARKSVNIVIESAGVLPHELAAVKAALTHWLMSFSASADDTERERLKGLREEVISAFPARPELAAARGTVEFTLAYFSGWRSEEFDLRGSPVLVDPGEEVKGRAASLRAEAGVASMRPQALAELALLSPPDQRLAAEPSDSPWSDYVNRDVLQRMLGEHVATMMAAHAYADQWAHDPGRPIDESVDAVVIQMAQQRSAILAMVRDGRGLEPMERDLLRCLVDEAEIGEMNVPALVLVDERSKKLADLLQRSWAGTRTAQTGEQQIISLLEDAGVGIGDLSNTAVEPVRSALESTTISIGGLARGFARDSAAARLDCHSHADELDEQLFRAGVGDDVRFRVGDALSESIAAAYEHAMVTDERGRWFDARMRTVAAKRDRAAILDQPAAATVTVAGVDDTTTTTALIEAVLPPAPARDWTVEETSPGSGSRPGTDVDTGPDQ
ncbi:hypothetical protein ACQP1G_20520 [Nocardia sp. CA-107356]|uniref:hypothetical protein n=1 Tax=Nocardia sp. CA-107356 TaxID=3239972 RepID=UPI003D8CB437